MFSSWLPLWLPLALASAFFAALVAVFGKLGLDRVDTTVATAARAAVMFVTLAAVVVSTGKLSQLSSITGRPLLYVVLAGLAGALSWLCYFAALKLGRASQVAVVDRLSIVFVILLAALFLSEKLTWKSGLGSVLVAAGAILIGMK